MAGIYENRQVGDFRVLNLMKAHANIEQYRATQHSVRRIVLFKAISLSNIFENDQPLIAAFRQYVDKVVALEHLHLQPVYGYGMLDDEHLYVVGRLISASLSDLVLSGPMPLEQALLLALQIASAMIYVHAQGLVHASLSPSNCYLGEDQNIYVNDLELSTLIQAVRSLHDLEVLLEEPYYAAVEQLRLHPLDIRSEVYALGAILYYMVTGKPPFAAEDNSFEAVRSRKTSNEITRPRVLVPAIPAELEHIILRALRANPDERFPDVTVMSQELQQLTSSGSATDAPPLSPPQSPLQSIISRFRLKR